MPKEKSDGWWEPEHMERAVETVWNGEFGLNAAYRKESTLFQKLSWKSFELDE